jgi:hypothetical protein
MIDISFQFKLIKSSLKLFFLTQISFNLKISDIFIFWKYCNYFLFLFLRSNIVINLMCYNSQPLGHNTMVKNNAFIFQSLKVYNNNLTSELFPVGCCPCHYIFYGCVQACEVDPG